MKIFVLYIIHLMTIQFCSLNFRYEIFDLGSFQFITISDTTSDEYSEGIAKFYLKSGSEFHLLGFGFPSNKPTTGGSRKPVGGSYVELTSGSKTNTPIQVNYLLSEEIHAGTQISITEAGVRFSVQPNPVDEGFTIEFPSALDDVQILLLDTTGKVVMRKQMSGILGGGSVYMSTTVIPAGIYFNRVSP